MSSKKLGAAIDALVEALAESPGHELEGGSAATGWGCASNASLLDAILASCRRRGRFAASRPERLLAPPGLLTATHVSTPHVAGFLRCASRVKKKPCQRAKSGLAFCDESISGPRHTIPLVMAAMLYRCATTGQNVQVWFADDVSDDSVFVSLRCPACPRVHLVNRAGRTLMPPRP